MADAEIVLATSREWSESNVIAHPRLPSPDGLFLTMTNTPQSRLVIQSSSYCRKYHRQVIETTVTASDAMQCLSYPDPLLVPNRSFYRTLHDMTWHIPLLHVRDKAQLLQM
ncbi:hypothetical protein V2G26_004522 [Clonostachys chloroleuca]